MEAWASRLLIASRTFHDEATRLLRYPTEFNSFVASLVLHSSCELFLRAVVHGRENREDWKYEQLLNHADRTVKAAGHLSGIRNQDAFRAIKADRDPAAHHGHVPSADRLGENLPRVREVMIEVARVLFDIEYEEISRAHLIENTETRGHLLLARESLVIGEIRRAIWESWKAYRSIIEWLPSLFEPSVSFVFGGVPRDFSILIGLSPVDANEPKGRAIWELSEAVLEIEQALRLVSLGLPTHQFYGFLAAMKLMPESVRFQDNYNDEEWEREPDQPEARFVVETVEEIAFRAQAAARQVPYGLVE